MEHDATINGSLGDTITRKRKRPKSIVIHFRPKRAARQFFRIKELLLLLVPYVPFGDLPQLCRVNKEFNSAFSAGLYRDISLDYKFLVTKRHDWAATNERFAHTKVFSFTYPFQPMSHGDGSFVQKIATDILRHSPTLHTITLDATPIGSDKAVRIINHGFDNIFQQSSTRLQYFNLKLSASPCPELSPAIFQVQNLKHLVLNNIPTASWRVVVLCRILQHSTGLIHVELSYLHGAQHQWSLEAISRQYNQLGAAPLTLDTLILGRGVELRRPVFSYGTGASGSTPAGYLALLVDLTRLQELGITAKARTDWRTFDSAFFPRMNQLRLNASIRDRDHVDAFLAIPKCRDFLRQVHLCVGGTLFQQYNHFRDMTRSLFRPRDWTDPASHLAPMGFSFHSMLRWEVHYDRSVALPLPTTRYLDITIHYRHLVGFCRAGLSQMSALECLSLNIYVRHISEWDDEIGEKQRRALELAGENCPKLRYMRLKFGATGPVSPRVAAFSYSAEIYRVRPRRCRNLRPRVKVFEGGSDKSLRPRSMWTEEEKKDEYMEEVLDKLRYYNP